MGVGVVEQSCMVGSNGRYFSVLLFFFFFLVVFCSTPIFGTPRLFYFAAAAEAVVRIVEFVTLELPDLLQYTLEQHQQQ